ncbi:hypothetical protein DRN58_06350 [Thermococci archaeon]|nr:MAG: hypothetical protein DRN58_06350 [Thermococci archaeon]
MNIFRRLYVAVSREIRIVTSPSFVFQSIFEPLIYLGIFAPLMGRVLSTVTYQGIEYSYIAFLLPGILTLTAFTTGIRSGSSFRIEYSSGEIETLFSLPVRRSELYFSKMFGIVIQTWIETTILLVLGTILAEGLLLSPMRIVWIFLVTGGFCIIFAPIIILLSSIMKNSEAPMAIMTLIMMPLMMLSSVFYPVVGEGMLSTIMRINPISQAAHLLRTCLLVPSIEFFNVILPIIYLVLIGVVTTLSGLWAYSRALEN